MNSEDLYDNLPVIETQSGFFNINDERFDILSIAGGLSKKCRFNGQCSLFYSVAEHSLLVSNIMDELKLGSPFEGLMHDANEAYLPDVPSPYKQSLPDLRALENKVDSRMRHFFKLPPKKTAGCGYADCVALMMEAYHLLPSKGTGLYWAPMQAFRPIALQLMDNKRFWTIGMTPKTAEHLFLNAFYELSERETP